MLVEPTRSRNDITGGVKLRPVRNRSTVKKDLTAAGARYHFWSFSKTFFPTLDNFAKLPEASYRVIMDKINELADENLICRVRLGDPGEITRLSERDFSAIPIERWQDCLAGTTLNLIKLWTLAPLVDKTASPPPAMGNGLTSGTKHLVGISYTAADLEEALSVLPAGSNPDEIFEAVRPLLSGLNANNILAYMPTGERDQTTGQRKWTRRVCLTDPRFQKLIDNDTRWEDGVTRLLQPQLSVASSSSKRDVFVVDIDDEKTFTEQGLIPDQKVLAGYRSKTARVNGCRREMMYIRLWQTRERKKVIGVVALHKFVPVPRPGDPELKVEPFLPDPRGLAGEKRVHAVAQRKVTIHQIKTIFTNGLAPYLASALAEAEEVTPLPGPPPRAPGAPTGNRRKGPSGSHKATPLQYDPTSEMVDFVGLKIERQMTPTLNYAKVKDRVVNEATEVAEESIGESPPFEEMEEHAFNVHVSETARDREKVAAFGTSKYFEGYVNNRGKREQLTMLWGTMVRPQYRRKGLMIKLNYDLILAAKIAVKSNLRGWAILKRLFVPAPMVVRTQSRAVWEACNRHFFGVTEVGEENLARYQHMVEYIANEMEWELDGKNVQRSAYTSKRVQNESSLIPGLGEYDAYVFAGDFTLWREIMTKAYVHIYYPLKEFYKARWGKRK